jgi:LmbE family N-acetylglucosaminyl deacetylase
MADMNVLAIGAHFDDVELGCGGALAVHAARGDSVYVFVATLSGFTNQYDQSVRSNDVARAEAEEAMRVLGIKQMFCGDFKTLQVEFVDELNVQILRLVEQLGIDQVYAHWTGDIHHDHQAVARASLHSCRHVPRLLMYRSNWYHSTLDFRGTFYVDISNQWGLKEQAILAHQSEMNRTGEKWINFFRNEAENAGQRIGVNKAEVFEVVKWLA